MGLPDRYGSVSSQGAKVVIAGLTTDEKRFEVARALGFDRIV